MSCNHVNINKSRHREHDQPIERGKGTARDRLPGFKQNLELGEGWMEEKDMKTRIEDGSRTTSLKHLKKTRGQRMRGALQTVFMEAHERGEG